MIDFLKDCGKISTCNWHFLSFPQCFLPNYRFHNKCYLYHLQNFDFAKSMYRIFKIRAPSLIITPPSRKILNPLPHNAAF